MTGLATKRSRPRVDGKGFRLGEKKFFVKGVAYGPFAPNTAGEAFPAREQVERDFAQMRELGATVVRVYALPPRWVLELAGGHELRLLIDVPWHKQGCFLDSPSVRETAREAVRQAARVCAGHPAVFALSVVNEIPADIVRWSGAEAVAEFIDELIHLAKEQDPELLCTFGNFPPTEFLRPRNVDFHCFNVYLHQPRAFDSYLARLQMHADHKPLVLGELGIDSLRESEARQAELLAWQIETAFRNGLAGAVVYSFTDEWFKDGQPIDDWAFGLTTRARAAKPSFPAVQQSFAAAPYFPLPRCPSVSVVIACFNGSRTLKTCLESLEHLNYPDYEVILVDDGSIDATPEIVKLFPRVRYFRHAKNEGLSVARNTGLQLARGEIVAFTDADCRADEDWLYYLVGDLLRGPFAGVGGPNLLPPEDSHVAAAVMVSPGGPAHVMLTDREAEHIPGCNMAFYRSALAAIGGFDPLFRKAGDDVDVCWRLQQCGYKIGFSPAGFVWHYRRSTVGEYLRQQHGYGEAEALLVRRHPEYFNWAGGSLWRGRIYSPAKFGVLTHRSVIYHGTFGSAFFQSIYAAAPSSALMLLTTLEYHVLVTLPVLVLGVAFLGVRWPTLIPLGVASLLTSLGVCVAAAWQAELPKWKRRVWSRPLVALLFFLQPIVRGFARYQGRLTLHQPPLAAYENLDTLSVKGRGLRFNEVAYHNGQATSRLTFLAAVIERIETLGWSHKTDAGWSDFDVEIYGGRWCKLQLTTVAEGPGDHTIRCRLRTRWTLPARVGFWALLGLELLVIGVGSAQFRWLWLLLLSVPGLLWWLSRRQHDLRRIVAVFLDKVAEQLKLKKIGASLVPVTPLKRTAAAPTATVRVASGVTE
jgi:glycosyltransferase involved in cell wall biosynthesis